MTGPYADIHAHEKLARVLNYYDDRRTRCEHVPRKSLHAARAVWRFRRMYGAISVRFNSFHDRELLAAWFSYLSEILKDPKLCERRSFTRLNAWEYRTAGVQSSYCGRVYAFGAPFVQFVSFCGAHSPRLQLTILQPISRNRTRTPSSTHLLAADLLSERHCNAKACSDDMMMVMRPTAPTISIHFSHYSGTRTDQAQLEPAGLPTSCHSALPPAVLAVCLTLIVLDTN